MAEPSASRRPRTWTRTDQGVVELTSRKKKKKKSQERRKEDGENLVDWW